jgi:hypothetical protein
LVFLQKNPNNISFTNSLGYFINLNLKITLTLPIEGCWELRRKFSSPKTELKKRILASKTQKPSGFQNLIEPIFIQMWLGRVH